MAFKVVIGLVQIAETEVALASSAVPVPTQEEALATYLRATAAAVGGTPAPPNPMASWMPKLCLEIHLFSSEEPPVACVLEPRHTGVQHKAPDGRRWD